MSLNTFKFLKTYFSCLCCQEVSTQPIYLKCGHLFCFSCLKLSNQQDNVIKCPFCLEYVYMSQYDNFLVQSIITHIVSLNDYEFQQEFMNTLKLVKSNKEQRMIIDLLIQMKKYNLKIRNAINNGNCTSIVQKRKLPLELKPKKPIKSKMW